MVRAPKVFPAVAVANKIKIGMDECETSQANSPSEPPGATVEDMKALANKPQSSNMRSSDMARYDPSNREPGTRYIRNDFAKRFPMRSERT